MSCYCLKTKQTDVLRLNKIARPSHGRASPCNTTLAVSYGLLESNIRVPLLLSHILSLFCRAPLQDHIRRFGGVWGGGGPSRRGPMVAHTELVIDSLFTDKHFFH